MFLINSRFSQFSATQPAPPTHSRHTSRAPLIPKLRGQFAEFLNHDSLARLGILYLTTRVGLGYGRSSSSHPGFSRQYRIITSHPNRQPHQPSPTRSNAASRISPKKQATTLDTHNHQCAATTSLRHPNAHHTPHTTHSHTQHHPERQHHARQAHDAKACSVRRKTNGTRISTGHPSTTPVGLALGPD